MTAKNTIIKTKIGTFQKKYVNINGIHGKIGSYGVILINGKLPQ
jgi:hypothetical protein